MGKIVRVNFLSAKHLHDIFFFSHNSLINDLLLAFCLGCDDLDVKCSVFFMGCELQPNLVESKRPSIRRPAFLDAVSGPTFSTVSFKEAHAINLQYIPHLHRYLDTHASSTGDMSASQWAHKLLARRQKKSEALFSIHSHQCCAALNSRSED